MKISDFEQEIKIQLDAAGLDNPGFETRQLISGVLGISSGELLMRNQHSLEETDVKKIRLWALERARGVPLAYLTGKKGFYKHEFIVEPGVLVPRPESEHVVEVALERVAELKLNVRHLADLGSGSGILGLSLLLELAGSRLTAVDLSSAAARVTLRNADALGARSRMNMISLAVENYQPAHKFELIVANPPYVKEGDANIQPSVHNHEPHEALYSSGDGLAVIASWSEWTSRYLASGGIFVCEIGTGQSRAVYDIMSKLNFREIRIKQDLAGHDRVVSAMR